MSRILVTGGAGFLGSHLCKRLLDDGHEVTSFDDYSTGRRENIEHLRGNRRFHARRGDVRHPIHIVVDQIYNLACPASPEQYQIDPVRTMKTNVLGAINVLDLALNCGARVLQASTSEVYGDPDRHPQSESYWGNVNPTGPRACYDEGKRAAETLFLDYHRHHGVDVRVARIFNTYGPRMDPNDGRVVSNFLTQAIAGKPITIYGDGTQTRSFCYVDDMIDGLVRLMDSDLLGVANLGNPSECTIAYLAELAIETVGSRSVIAMKPLPVDDPRKRCPDISIVMNALDWQPKVPLRDGLARTAAYFRELDIWSKVA